MDIICLSACAFNGLSKTLLGEHLVSSFFSIQREHQYSLLRYFCVHNGILIPILCSYLMVSLCAVIPFELRTFDQSGRVSKTLRHDQSVCGSSQNKV